MSIRAQLKLALVLFYVVWAFLAFFTEREDVALAARAAALIMVVGIFGFLVGGRRKDS